MRIWGYFGMKKHGLLHNEPLTEIDVFFCKYTCVLSVTVKPCVALFDLSQEHIIAMLNTSKLLCFFRFNIHAIVGATTK